MYVQSPEFFFLHSFTGITVKEKHLIMSTGTKANSSSLNSLVLAIASLQEPDSSQMKACVTESHTNLREIMWCY